MPVPRLVLRVRRRAQGTRHTEGLEDFDASCYGLIPVGVEVVGGLVLVDLGGEAPAAAEHVGELAGSFERYQVDALARGGERHYDVAANWKAIAENYSECLHCPGVHPELNAPQRLHERGGGGRRGRLVRGLDDAERGRRDDGAGDGHAGPPPDRRAPGGRARHVLYFVLFPNALVSLHPDYVMLHTLWPR